MALPALDLYVNRYRETAPDLHVGQKLDPGPLKSSTLFPALHSWYSRPPGRGRLRWIAPTAGARAAAASAGARWLELRHGKRVPTRAEACAAKDSELQVTMRCVSRGFGDCATSRTRTQFRKRHICPAHPPHLPLPLIVVRCCMASEWSCPLGPPPTPPPPPSLPSQCCCIA